MSLMEKPLVPTKKGKVTIGGKEANIVCSNFGNKILICITHVCKFGTVIHISKNQVPEGQSYKAETYSIRVLLGKDDELHNVFARGLGHHILSDIQGISPPSLLLSLSLQQLTPDILKEVVHHLKSFTVW